MSHAIRFYKTGGPEVLVWEEVEVGKPGGRGARPPCRGRRQLYRHLHPPRPVPRDIAERHRHRGGRARRGNRSWRDRSQGRRSRGLHWRTARRLCGRACHAGGPSGGAARWPLRNPGGSNDAQRADRTVPHPADIQGQERRHHPITCGGGRRRPHYLPMGEVAGCDRHRYREQRVESTDCQGAWAWLRPRRSTISPITKSCRSFTTPSARTPS